MRWWLARGVDGFRLDVINKISKVAALPDAPMIRIGLHSGEVVSGRLYSGSTFEQDVTGLTVHLAAGDTVVQRGTNHAWSNRSDAPCLVAFSTHDGKL